MSVTKFANKIELSYVPPLEATACARFFRKENYALFMSFEETILVRSIFTLSLEATSSAKFSIMNTTQLCQPSMIYNAYYAMHIMQRHTVYNIFSDGVYTRN